MSQDPRAIANFVLEVAKKKGFTTSNLALNKIVYFLHGIYLARTGKPLVAAKIEAWQYGPVFREIYHSFKDYGNEAIGAPAQRVDYETGECVDYAYDLGNDEVQMLEPFAEAYLKLKPGRLVDMSHVEDGPWHEAWFHDGVVNPGMQITNESIRKHFEKAVRH